MAKDYITEIGMRNIEILQRRNKYEKPCVEDMNDDDDKILQWITKLVGCKLPYWNSSLEQAICSRQEQLKKAFRFQMLMLDDVGSINFTHKLACRRLEKFQLDVQDFEVEEMTSEPATIEFKFVFREFSYKEVKDVRSMDIQSLIGNTSLTDTLQATYYR